MSQEIRKTEGPRDETDDELTTADLAGTNQPTPKDGWKSSGTRAKTFQQKI
jgi:hypothetical protein